MVAPYTRLLETVLNPQIEMIKMIYNQYGRLADGVRTGMGNGLAIEAVHKQIQPRTFPVILHSISRLNGGVT
jgi:hypothetical protein